MRISKTTENYIRDLVYDKAKDKLKSLQDQKEIFQQKIEKPKKDYMDEIYRAVKKCEKECEKITEKHGMIKSRYEYRKPHLAQCYYEDLYKDSDAELIKASEKITKEINSLESAIQKKVVEIVSRLSLGGTAKDLDEMLANVSF